MEQPKNIQIPFETFLNCYKLLVCNMESDEILEQTQKQLTEKFEAITRRMLYTEYKTGESEEIKQQALQKYLDRIGVPPEYRGKLHGGNK